MYYDRNGQPIDEDRWLELFGDLDYRRIEFTLVGDSEVSTVWLGLNHGSSALGDALPLIFETLVIDGPLDGDMARYSTEEEARQGHAAMVEEVRDAADHPNHLR